MNGELIAGGGGREPEMAKKRERLYNMIEIYIHYSPARENSILHFQKSLQDSR